MTDPCYDTNWARRVEADFQAEVAAASHLIPAGKVHAVLRRLGFSPSSGQRTMNVWENAGTGKIICVPDAHEVNGEFVYDLSLAKTIQQTLLDVSRTREGLA